MPQQQQQPPQPKHSWNSPRWALAILLALLFAAYLKTRLGGITGDTIGATIELVEIAALLVFLCTWTSLP